MKIINKKYLSLIFICLVVGLGLTTLSACSQNKSDSDIAYYTCPMHPQIHDENPGQCPICGMDLVAVKKSKSSDQSLSNQTGTPAHQPSGDASNPELKTYYTCPMHPEVHNDGPGQCPKCGMNLEEFKLEKKEQTRRQIEIDPEYTQLIGVKTELVQKKNLVKTFSAYGKVAHDPELWVSQNELLQAMRLGDRSLIQSAELKLEYLGLSREWIEHLKQKGKADSGLHFDAAKGRRFLEAFVYAGDINHISLDQQVAILDQGARYLDSGRVRAISTLASLETRSIRVLIEAQKDLNLKLNTFVQFRFQYPLGDMLAVPKEAVLFNGERNIVYVHKAPGVYQPTEIQVGEEVNQSYVVISGLHEGESVVTNGTFLLDSETQIKLGLNNEAHAHEP